MTSLATAFVTIRPDTTGFATKLKRDTTVASAAAGNEAGKKMGSGFTSKLGAAAKLGGAVLGGAAVLGAVSFAKNSSSLEAEFSKTMNKFQAATDLPASGMKRMQDLALKMGADTVFSASEASDAMLALAKSGIRPATIEAGALEAALTLAAAGELEMGTAAEVMGNALNTFNLKGNQAAAVSAALAGAANASSASVESLAQGLQQVGTVAADAGFTVQETTGAMAALANAGIAGSDAGTSLKTMFANLQPATKAARDAFENFGLSSYQSTNSMKELEAMGIKPVSSAMGDVSNAIRDYLVRTGEAAEGTKALEDKTTDLLYETGMMQNAFIKTNGEFKSLGAISGILEEKFADLSSSERAAALQTLFGSDARRAATVLTKEGADGLAKYVKATSDQGAAEKMAAAAMKGTAGAAEALAGSWETLQLQFGLFTAPARVAAMNLLTDVINGIPPAIEGISAALSGGGGGGGFAAFAEQARKAGGALKDFIVDLLPTFRQLATSLGEAFSLVGGLVTNTLLPAFTKMLPILQPVAKFLLEMFGSAVVGFIKGVVQAVKGFVDVITGTVDLFKALIKGDWSAAWASVKKIAKGAMDLVVGFIKAWFNFGILAIFKQGAKKLLSGWKGLWEGLKALGKRALLSITLTIKASFALVSKLFAAAVKAFTGFWKGLFGTLRSITVNGWKVLRSTFGGAVAAIRTVLTQSIQAYVGFWKGLFATLKSVASRAWTGIQIMFGIVFAKIKGAFSAAVRAIGQIWNGLKDAARKPVEFIVNTVYMEGIRKVVNAIPGVTPLPPMSFADGGVMPGYTPGRDVHDFYSPTAGRLRLSGGEAFMVPEWTRAMGGEKAVKRMNENARRGMFHGPDHGGFAGGGVFRPVAGGSTSGRIHGSPPAIDISVPTGSVVASVMSGRVASSYDIPGYESRAPHGGLGYRSYGRVIEVMHNGFKTLYAHLSRRDVGAGAMVSAGQRLGLSGNTGYSFGPHIHFGSSGPNPNNFLSGGTGYSGGAGSPGDSGGFMSSIANPLRFLDLSGWKDKLGGMGDWGRMMGQMAGNIVPQVTSWAKDKISSAFGKVTGWLGDKLNIGSGSSSAGSMNANNLVPIMQQAMNFAKGKWGPQGLNTIYGYANRNIAGTNTKSDHAYGKALDFMTYSNMGLGDEIARYFRGPGQSKFNIDNVIWRAPDHYDHVHIDTFDRGGLSRGEGRLQKNTIRPERVLSPRQTEAFERWMDNQQGGRVPTVHIENMHTRDDKAAARELAREQQKAYTLARLA